MRIAVYNRLFVLGYRNKHGDFPKKTYMVVCGCGFGGTHDPINYLLIARTFYDPTIGSV